MKYGKQVTLVSGTVTNVGYDLHRNWHVEIQEKSGCKVMYQHMSKALVNVGDKLSIGHTIGMR